MHQWRQSAVAMLKALSEQSSHRALTEYRIGLIFMTLRQCKEQNMDEMKKRFELTEKILSVLTKASFGLGSAIFLVYCMMNGGFPDSLSLADSLRILYVFTVFSGGTLIFYFFLMCLGLSICHLTYRLANTTFMERILYKTADWANTVSRRITVLRRGPSEFHRTRKRPRKFIHHVVFPPVAHVFHGISVLTVVLIVVFVQHDRLAWYVRLLTSAVSLAVWFIILDVNRQRQKQLKFVLPGPEAIERAERDIRTGNFTITLVIPILVTMMLGLFGDSANHTMRILGFRQEHATVYIRETWSTVLTRHGIVGVEADLKPYVSRYDNVTVALTSFGTSVTLQFHTDSKLHTLLLPASEVLIDPLHTLPSGD